MMRKNKTNVSDEEWKKCRNMTQIEDHRRRESSKKA